MEDKVYNNFLINGDFINEENHGFLILDKASFHCTDNIIKEFQKGNRAITFIPLCLTRFYQPLDVSKNKLFKSALREKYIAYCIDNGYDNIKISRTKMIEFICVVWYNDSIISKDVIYKSFRATGIANYFDHSEDYLFS